MNNEQLVARIQGGDNEAENMFQLWKQNKGFIAMIARRYSSGGGDGGSGAGGIYCPVRGGPAL